MDDKSLESIGKAVLGVMLSDNSEMSRILTAQMEHVMLRTQDQSPVGWFTHFDVIGEIVVLPGRENFHISADATVADMRMGIGFVLFVVEGKLDMLEAFTYDEELPSEIKILSIKML